MWLKKGSERDNRKSLKSCVGTEGDCCKTVILRLKREYRSYRHFSWSPTFLQTWLFCSYCQEVVKFFEDFHQYWKGRGDRRASLFLVLEEAYISKKTE